MVSSFLTDIYNSPFNTIHIVGISMWWFYLWNYNVPADKVAYQYDKVVNDGHYWRIVSSTLAHLNILHVAFNMMSLYMVAGLEQYLGSIAYLRISFVLMIGSMMMDTFIIWAMSRIPLLNARFPHQRQQYSLGYSGVVFGWIVIFSMMHGGAMSFFGLVNVPYFAYPFVALIITSLIIPNASFIGHLAGLLIGFLVYFDVFNWFTNYLYLTAATWTAVVFVWSLKTTTDFDWLQFIKISSAAEYDDRPERTMVNGEIVFVDRSGEYDGQV